MPLRSGKVLPRDGASQWITQGNTAPSQQLALKDNAARATKRTRSSRDASPTDLAQEDPASKRRVVRRRARSPVASKQARPAEIIDLTGDDGPDEEIAHQSFQRYNMRSTRSSVRPHRAFQDVMEGPELEDYIQSAYDYGADTRGGDGPRDNLHATPPFKHQEEAIVNIGQDLVRFDDCHLLVEEDGCTSWRVRSKPVAQPFEAKTMTRTKRRMLDRQKADMQLRDHDSIQEEDGHAAWSLRNELVQETGRGGGGRSTGHSNNDDTPTMAAVMYTQAEAIQILERISQGTPSHVRPPYTLQTGEYISFPVIMSYYLGGMGRFGRAPSQVRVKNFGEAATKDGNITSPSAPGSMLKNSDHASIHEGRAPPRKAARGMLPAAADYVFDWGTNYGKSIREVGRLYIASVLASPRLDQLLEEHDGLREALTLYAPNNPRLLLSSSSSLPFSLPMRPSASTSRAPASGLLPNRPRVSKTLQEMGLDTSGSPPYRATKDYILDFGHFRGKSLEQVTPAYVQELEQNEYALTTHVGLRAALTSFWDRHPEKYRVDFGKHRGKTLHEVPNEYLSMLESGSCSLIKKEVLQRVLWHYNEKMRRSNVKLSKTLDRFEQMQGSFKL